MEVLWYGEGFSEENERRRGKKIRKASWPAGRGLADSNSASGSNQFQWGD
jgi:hypothetical protein